MGAPWVTRWIMDQEDQEGQENEQVQEQGQETTKRNSRGGRSCRSSRTETAGRAGAGGAAREPCHSAAPCTEDMKTQANGDRIYGSHKLALTLNSHPSLDRLAAVEKICSQLLGTIPCTRSGFIRSG